MMPLSPTAMNRKSLTSRRASVVPVARGVHVAPMSVETRSAPPSPTAMMSPVSSMAAIAWRSFVVPLVCGAQEAPPFVVCTIVPPLPHAHATLTLPGSIVTPCKSAVVPLSWRNQPAPAGGAAHRTTRRATAACMMEAIALSVSLMEGVVLPVKRGVFRSSASKRGCFVPMARSFRAASASRGVRATGRRLMGESRLGATSIVARRGGESTPPDSGALMSGRFAGPTARRLLPRLVAHRPVQDDLGIDELEVARPEHGSRRQAFPDEQGAGVPGNQVAGRRGAASEESEVRVGCVGSGGGCPRVAAVAPLREERLDVLSVREPCDEIDGDGLVAKCWSREEADALD